MEKMDRMLQLNRERHPVSGDKRDSDEEEKGTHRREGGSDKDTYIEVRKVGRMLRKREKRSARTQRPVAALLQGKQTLEEGHRKDSVEMAERTEDQGNKRRKGTQNSKGDQTPPSPGTG